MTERQKWPVPFVLIRRDAAMRDGEVAGQPNKLRIPGNNGRKILATEVVPQFGEKEICDPLWHVPYVLPTGEGGVEIATFTEFAGQDRHKHETGLETYTVLKGTMEIYINDAGPYPVHEMEEIVILPCTVHEVVENIPNQKNSGVEFALLVRVHSINCLGGVDKLRFR
ncbi:MAG: hypothetical protein NTZ17_01470 [Phycisphaerae bacterium]|nr:hypothetical protein [Phycisphaerae bacterium]